MPAALLAIAAVLMLPAAATAQGKPAAPSAEGRWIVVYERGAVDDVDRETDARERRRGFRSRLRFRRAVEGFAARLSADQVRALRADPDVEAVVPDRPVRALAAQAPVAGEPLAPTGVRRIGAASEGWLRQASGVGVAVLDTGVDLEHPDLNVADGTDCTAPGTSADDDDGHGTHVAGTVGALNDGGGVAGVAPGTRIQAVKVLDSQGVGSDSQVMCGVDWTIANAAARNIRVLNLSLGRLNEHNRNCGRATPDPASTLVDPMHDAICRIAAAGIVPVVAAGNDAWNISEFEYDVPASYPEVLTVTAIADRDGAPGGADPEPPCSGQGADDTPATFSNFTRSSEEAAHTIAAPGVCITSTWPLDVAADPPANPPAAAGYHTISGTSMAAPHAAAAVALCIDEAGVSGPCAGMAPAQIVQKLRADATAFVAANPGWGYAGETAEPPDRYFGPLLRAPASAPDTTFSALPPESSEDTTPSFEFGASAPGAGFECSLDGGAFAACDSPLTTGPVPPGTHELAVRAVDVAGNADASPATDTFTVVAAPSPPPPDPVVDVTAPAIAYGVSSRQRIATVSRNGIRVNAGCSEACSLRSAIVVSGREALRLGLVRRSAEVTAGRRNGGLASGRRTLTIRLTSAVRRRLARARSALVQLRLVARDASGNERTVRKSVRLVR